MSYNDERPVSVLLGLTLVRVEQVADDRIEFDAASGEKFAMFHDQECCESVTVDDIAGDLSDLVGSPITMAESVSGGSEDGPEFGSKDTGYGPDESWTWTFYKFATLKGYVTIKWYGASNGYYSERVTFEQVHRGIVLP